MKKFLTVLLVVCTVIGAGSSAASAYFDYQTWKETQKNCCQKRLK